MSIPNLFHPCMHRPAFATFGFIGIPNFRAFHCVHFTAEITADISGILGVISCTRTVSTQTALFSVNFGRPSGALRPSEWCTSAVRVVHFGRPSGALRCTSAVRVVHFGRPSGALRPSEWCTSAVRVVHFGRSSDALFGLGSLQYFLVPVAPPSLLSVKPRRCARELFLVIGHGQKRLYCQKSRSHRSQQKGLMWRGREKLHRGGGTWLRVEVLARFSRRGGGNFQSETQSFTKSGGDPCELNVYVCGEGGPVVTPGLSDFHTPTTPSIPRNSQSGPGSVVGKLPASVKTRAGRCGASILDLGTCRIRYILGKNGAKSHGQEELGVV
eukprot:gene18846-biopygen21990